MSKDTIIVCLRSTSGMLSGRTADGSIPEACQAFGTKDETRHVDDGDLRRQYPPGSRSLEPPHCPAAARGGRHLAQTRSLILFISEAAHAPFSALNPHVRCSIRSSPILPAQGGKYGSNDSLRLSGPVTVMWWLNEPYRGFCVKHAATLGIQRRDSYAPTGQHAPDTKSGSVTPASFCRALHLNRASRRVFLTRCLPLRSGVRLTAQGDHLWAPVTRDDRTYR